VRALAGLLVVIPALNEEATVAAVVRGARERLVADVLVVDDGSTDRTAEIAQAAGAFVLSHPFNLGVGAALRSGFRYAAERGYTMVLQLDADGQHDPASAPSLIAPLDEGVDIVVGSRFAAGFHTGRLRRLCMRWLARIVSRRTSVAVTDTTSGFRAFGKRAVERFAVSYPTEYLSDTVEALLLAAAWQLEIREVPVEMRPRQGGQPSTGSVKSLYHLIRLVLVIALHRVRQPIDQRRH
jgi:glycosyltransferase involved in cell wall biosynthesis